ncbi:MAG: 4Fe-4S dicluster domain-containing protein [Tannerellaceae bacterium]|jgi:NAD-dependent dihydropyrimidine dehydrogenase PreA subunit|nr:4Fe-4S dicluster domain-containing protein [Tannerellaceae bacterium]
MKVEYIIVGIVLLLWILGDMYRRHKNRNKVICVVERNCTGCGRCVKRCTRHVLEKVKDETGIHLAVKYPDKCTACGDCIGKCKFEALKLTERK